MHKRENTAWVVYLSLKEFKDSPGVWYKYWNIFSRNSWIHLNSIWLAGFDISYFSQVFKPPKPPEPLAVHDSKLPEVLRAPRNGHQMDAHSMMLELAFTLIYLIYNHLIQPQAQFGSHVAFALPNLAVSNFRLLSSFLVVLLAQLNAHSFKVCIMCCIYYFNMLTSCFQ